MKYLIISISCLFISIHSIAIDVCPSGLRDKMVQMAKKRVYSICEGKENTFFQNSFQVHDGYLKHEGDSSEDEKDIYYYAPKITGAAFCKSKNILVQWTAHSDLDFNGELVYSGLITTLSVVE